MIQVMTTVLSVIMSCASNVYIAEVNFEIWHTEYTVIRIHFLSILSHVTHVKSNPKCDVCFSAINGRAQNSLHFLVVCASLSTLCTRANRFTQLDRAPD